VQQGIARYCYQVSSSAPPSAAQKRRAAHRQAHQVLAAHRQAALAAGTLLQFFVHFTLVCRAFFWHFCVPTKVTLLAPVHKLQQKFTPKNSAVHWCNFCCKPKIKVAPKSVNNNCVKFAYSKRFNVLINITLYFTKAHRTPIKQLLLRCKKYWYCFLQPLQKL